MYRLIACIVIYNTEFEDIKNTINEFYKKDIKQKLVIVDNSNTGYLKNKVLELNSNIDYICSENIGYGRGNNIAIDKYKNKAEYFIILNPDIIFSIEDIEKLIEFAQLKKEFGIIMPKIVYPDGRNQYLCKLIPTPLNLFMRRFLPNFSLTKKLDYKYEYRFSNYKKEMKVPILSGCFMFCNYKNLVKEGGFDKRYFLYMEDVDLSRKMLKYGNYCYPEVKAAHEFGKASFKSLKMTLIHVKSSIKYFNKWGWFFDKERKTVNLEMIKKYNEIGGI